MRKVRTHKFNGVKYELDIYTAMDGQCDFRHNKDATPYIITSCKPYTKLWLETLIHESLHAEDWRQTEHTVGRVAKEISDLLWRIGWRCDVLL